MSLLKVVVSQFLSRIKLSFRRMVGWRRARWIMSVAEVELMAMAKLLVVMFEDIRAAWQDICLTQRRTRGKSLSWWGVVVLVTMVVMLIKGHRVEVGVGVLPIWEGRRCYSGLWPWYRYQRWWRCRRGDVVYRGVQQMELMKKAVVTEWTVVMWWTV